MTKIEKIKRVPLRDIWRYEDRDFTTWLQENIEVINEVLDLQLGIPNREQSTGNFSVDLVAEDYDGQKVIIENQLEKSDHDHLGKVITYLAAVEAKAAIWIASNPRTEHINAMTWLNETVATCSFYLVKIEAIVIGDSKPAPLLTLIVGPSEQSREVGKIKKEDAERIKQRETFWSLLLEKSGAKHALFNTINPTGKDSWCGVTAGVTGILYTFWVNQFDSRAEIRIDFGKEKDKENLEFFHELKQNQEAIEQAFGAPLIWDEAENYRVCIVQTKVNGGFKSEEDVIDSVAEKLADTMHRLVQASKNHIQKIGKK